MSKNMIHQIITILFQLNKNIIFVRYMGGDSGDSNIQILDDAIQQQDTIQDEVN